MKQGYVGIENDMFGGMTDQGRIIRDAWVFGILPEDQGCAGWSAGQIQELYETVHAEWEKYGHIPSQLPPDICARYMRFYEQAVIRAREHGWNPELTDDN